MNSKKNWLIQRSITIAHDKCIYSLVTSVLSDSQTWAEVEGKSWKCSMFWWFPDNSSLCSQPLTGNRFTDWQVLQSRNWTILISRCQNDHSCGYSLVPFLNEIQPTGNTDPWMILKLKTTNFCILLRWSECTVLIQILLSNWSQYFIILKLSQLALSNRAAAKLVPKSNSLSKLSIWSAQNHFIVI